MRLPIAVLGLAITALVVGGCTPPDDVGAPAYLESPPPLQEVFRSHFLVGAAVNDNQMASRDPHGAALVRYHFNSISSENVLKWERVHPAPGVFAFEASDRFVEFGEENDMYIVGHTLVWHSQTPDWVFQDEGENPIGREALIERMRNHIHTVVGRYRGRVHAWDVVNEALNMDGTLRQTPWLQLIGEEYLALAFEFAREADPHAQLYYNDYEMENPRKRAGAIKLIQNLLDQGVRVDGVGTQSHFLLHHPSLEEIEQTILDLAALGTEVMVTELEVAVLQRSFDSADVAVRAAFSDELNPYVDGLPTPLHDRLAQRYRDIFEIYIRHSDVLQRVTFWGVTDGDSWLNNWPIRGRTAHPLLFGRDHEPKPAFGAVIEAAMEH
jgi:endo-1,4-beta-xylanase